MDKNPNINTKEYWDVKWLAKNPWGSLKLDKILIKTVEPNSSVLDIGCGAGRVLKSLKKRKNCQVMGFDISEVAIKKLNDQGIEGMVGNAEEFNYEGNGFDVILISHTLEHIENDELLISRIAKLTKKYAIISVPNDMITPEEEPEHLRTYNKISLLSLVGPYFGQIEDLSSGNHLILKCLI